MVVNRARILRQLWKFRVLGMSLLFTVVFISLAVAISGSSRKIKVMPLGDSITGSFSGMASYRFWLWEELVAAGFGDKVQFVGQRCGTGDQDSGGYGGSPCGQPKYDCSVWSNHHNGYHDKNIRDILMQIPRLIRLDTADVVMIHLGINDIAYGDYPTMQGSANAMGALIDSIRVVNPHVTVLLCKIIPAALNEEGTDSLIRLNDLFGQLGQQKSLPTSPVIVVDQYTNFPGQDLMPDGFHPNEAGEQYMAGNFYNALLPVLQAMNSISATMVPYTHDTQVTAGSVLNLSATVHAYPCVSDVAFVNDTMVLGHGTQMPDSSFSYSFNVSQPGFNNIRAVVTDFTGRIDTSNAILFGAASNTVAVPLTISQIQGSTAPSPNANVLAKTTGIVTAVRKDSTGFWIQDSISDPNHVVSSGLFVSRNSTVTMPHPGDLVLVRGIVQDFQPLSKYLPQTRLSCVDSIAVLASGMRLPAAQFISVVPNGPFDISTLMSQYPGYEGMLLSFGATAIVAPSSQQCAFVPAGNLGSGSGVYLSSRVAVNESRASQIVDYNPEALLLGSKTCALPPARALDTLISLTGVADYDNGFISIQPIADSLRISHSATPVSPVSKRSSNSGTLRITTFDLGGLFDTLDQWGKNDPVLSAAAYKVKLAKTGKAINAELLMPAILCVQNCENTQVFADLAAYVNKSGGKYKIATARHYMGFSVDTPSTTDPRGLINGFLYDSTQFGLDSVKLIRGGSIDSSFGAYSALPAAQPVVGFFRVSGTQLAIVNFSLCDKSGDDPYFCYSWPLAAISKTVRDAQAAAVRAWIDRKLASVPSQLMLVAGEFNDYPFAEATDGAGYPVSIVAGNPAKGETVFYNAYDYLSPDSRYTCIANGRAQMTEQVLVSPGLASYAKAVDVLHFNANFEDSFASDSTTAVRCSNSDPIEVRF